MTGSANAVTEFASAVTEVAKEVTEFAAEVSAVSNSLTELANPASEISNWVRELAAEVSETSGEVSENRQPSLGPPWVAEHPSPEGATAWSLGREPQEKTPTTISSPEGAIADPASLPKCPRLHRPSIWGCTASLSVFCRPFGAGDDGCSSPGAHAQALFCRPFGAGFVEDLPNSIAFRVKRSHPPTGPLALNRLRCFSLGFDEVEEVDTTGGVASHD